MVVKQPSSNLHIILVLDSDILILLWNFLGKVW